MEHSRAIKRTLSHNKTNNRRSYSTNKYKRNNTQVEAPFRIRLYSTQQIVLTIFIFMLILIMRFLPPAEGITMQISELISEDIKIEEVYSHLDSIIDKAQKPLEYFDKLKEW